MPHPVVVVPPSVECSSCNPNSQTKSAVAASKPCWDDDCPWNEGLWGLDPTQRLGRLIGWLSFVEVRLRDAHGRPFAGAIVGWGDRVVAAKRSYDRAWWVAHVAEGAVAASEAEIQALGAELGAALEPRSGRPFDEVYLALAETPCAYIDASDLLDVLSMAVDALAHEEVPVLRAFSSRYAVALATAEGAVKTALAAREQLRQAMSWALATYEAAHGLYHELDVALSRYAEEHHLGSDWARQRLRP